MGADRRYRFAHLTISSPFPLPELSPATRRADWAVTVDRHVRPFTGPWLRRGLKEGRPWLEIAAAPEARRYYVRFVGAARFEIDERARTIVCAPSPGLPARSLRYLLLSQVLPLVASRGRQVVLHASAVSWNGGAVAFMGDGGYGKSTLAAALAERGAGIVTDDCLIVDVSLGRPAVTPTYAGLRLWPDSARALFGRVRGKRAQHWTSKRHVDATRVATRRRIHLERLYVLQSPARMARATRVTMTPMTGRAAFLSLLAQSFHLDLFDVGQASAVLDRIAGIVETVPIYRLTYPRDWSKMDSVIEALDV